MSEKWLRYRYQPNTPIGADGRKVTESPEHIALARKAAKEGMVLLKNNNCALPLKPHSRIALFGKATFDYVRGGGGSGEVSVAYERSLYDGFKLLPSSADVFEPSADFYRDYVREQRAAGFIPGMVAEPEIPAELLAEAARFTDTAVVSISRFSGEGWDRKSDFGSAGETFVNNSRLIQMADKIFERGDFFLTAGEEAMLDAVEKEFDHVIVVLNVGGMITTRRFREDDKIEAVLLAWQGGMEGGTAAAELLTGISTPSGKLPDTFAGSLEDYPSSPRFHESDDYVDYNEDIYVGYRYFETVPGAAEKVVYPFGYGLSYTTFALENVNVCCENCCGTGNGADGSCCKGAENGAADSCIKVTLDVVNTGSFSGREVVQVYYGAPQGKLGKPAKELAAYHKTRLLAPGETERVKIIFPVAQMASYDDLGKVAKSAWVLEKGEYAFYVGTDVRSAAKQEFSLKLEDDTVTEQLTERMAPTSLKERMLADGSYEELPQREPVDTDASALVPMSHEDCEGNHPESRYVAGFHHRRTLERPQFADVAAGKITLDDFIAALPDKVLADMLGGQPNTGVANTFGYGNIYEYGIPNIMTADGPAGLRIRPNLKVTTTAFPCSTLIASTWDPEIAFAVGEAAAAEVKENNIGFWLTPAVNIHRSPLCGRNFEYYSEDPYLAGMQAAGMVRGIQSQRIGATVKHFALNNKESNRKNSDSRASERAIREIYLKQFEIIVKTARPWSIMTSYNIINGTRASENADLLNGILRGEWGFDGFVTTDWWTFGEHYKEVSAGNDIKMGCGYPDRLMEALEKGALTRESLETAARHLLGIMLRLD